MINDLTLPLENIIRFKFQEPENIIDVEEMLVNLFQGELEALITSTRDLLFLAMKEELRRDGNH
jgi:hypothetical protein